MARAGGSASRRSCGSCACSRRWAWTRCATGGEPLVRRDLPVLVRLLADTLGVEDLSLTTTTGFLARPARGSRSSSGLRQAERLARLALARPLRRDHPAATRSTACSPGSTRPSATPSCGQSGQLRRVRGFTESGSGHAELARRKPYVVRFIEFMPLDADESWRGDGDADRRRDPRADRGALAARSPPSPRPRRSASVSPTAPARSVSSTRSPSRSAPAATASASPPTASSAPASSHGASGT